MKQQQFLNLASAEEAEERFWQGVQPGPLGEELIPELKSLLNIAQARIDFLVFFHFVFLDLIRDPAKLRPSFLNTILTN